MRYYTLTHEWIQIEGDIGTVGITQHAQKELGEVVYAELPEKGKAVQAGNEAVILESTKAAADIYSPVTGRVTEVNGELKDNVDLINDKPEKEGWLFKLRITDDSEMHNLLNKEEYVQLISEAPSL